MTVADISVSVLVQDQNLFSEITDLKQMWVNAEAEDELYNELCQTIHKKQRSFSTVLKVRVFITNASWVMKKSYSFAKDTECVLRISLYRTDSVYTWLNNDWTLRKRCNWCSYHDSSFDLRCYRMSVHSAEIVTNAVWTTAEKTADKASWSLYLYEADLTKIFIDFVVDLLSSEGCMNLLIITDCLSKKVILKLCKNMTAEWVTQTFVQHFYWAHELLSQ
jgi:hypothetical protein